MGGVVGKSIVTKRRREAGERERGMHMD